MRLWSLHPRVLDRVGLVALWREGLLARKVLAGKTSGYRHHPQLERFRSADDPAAAIEAFLHEVQREATRRGYRFDLSKLGPEVQVDRIPVTNGQLLFEAEHLIRKLETRAPDWTGKVFAEPHPLFRIVEGGVEAWERVR